MFSHMKTVNHDRSMRQDLAHGRDVGVPHIGAHRPDLPTERRRDGGQPGDQRRLGPIRQDGEDDETPCGQSSGDDDDVVPMALLEGNLVNTQHRKRRQHLPIDARRHPALDCAEGDIVASIFLLADVLDGAMDQLHQEVMFVGRRVQRFGHVPT